MFIHLLLIISVLLLTIFSSDLQARYQCQKAERDTSKHVFQGRRRNKRKRILFKLEVEGIECWRCAQSAIDRLAQIQGIEEPEYIQQSPDYSDGYINFYWIKKQEELPMDELREQLAKEGFEFRAVNSNER